MLTPASRDGAPGTDRASVSRVEGSDVLVHTSADRRLAIEHWLLSTLPGPGREQARTEWQTSSMTMLRLGTLFSAVRIPGRLVLAAASQGPKRDQLDAFLGEALAGGPAIYDPHSDQYYALVPASMAEKYKQLAEFWRPLGVELLGRDTYLGVPPVDVIQFEPQCVSYWAVPMSSAAVLCPPLAVARVIEAGRRADAKSADA